MAHKGTHLYKLYHYKMTLLIKCYFVHLFPCPLNLYQITGFSIETNNYFVLL